MKPVVKNILLAVCVLILVAVPLFFVKGEFAGADDRSTQGILSIDPNYKPWFHSVFEPKSAEVESFLFAAQAAIGSGIVCFYLGYKKGQQKKSQKEALNDKY